MDVFEAISKRRSIRKYKDTAIEADKLDKILEAARIAPSAANRQEWKFLVVKDKETRQKLVNAANGQNFVGEAQSPSWPFQQNQKESCPAGSTLTPLTYPSQSHS
jgi:nitroreductase